MFPLSFEGNAMVRFCAPLQSEEKIPVRHKSERSFSTARHKQKCVQHASDPLNDGSNLFLFKIHLGTSIVLFYSVRILLLFLLILQILITCKDQYFFIN